MFSPMLPFMILALHSPEEDEYLIHIFKQYHGLMFTTACQYLRQEDLADETVNLSCYKLMPQIETLKGLSEPQLKAYLYRTAKHCAIDLVNMEAHQRGNSVPLDDETDWPDDDASAFMRVDERASLLADALERLSESDQEIIQWFYSDGYSLKEIATRLHVQPSSAASRLSRARSRLKQILIDMGMPKLL